MQYLACVALLAVMPISRTCQADALDAWTREQVASGGAGAMVVARIDESGRRVDGYGRRNPGSALPPDGDTRFQIGSISKVFTNLLLAERVALGAVRYEQVIGGLLPETVRPAHPQVAAISLLALATHRSGLPRLPPNLMPDDPADPYRGYGLDALWDGLATTRTGQPLGRFGGYSNFGSAVLGQLLAIQAGEDYPTLLRRAVIEPLRLRDTGIAPGDNVAVATSRGQAPRAWSNDHALAPAIGLWGSGNDLLRLLRVYLGGHAHGLRHALAEDLEIVPSEADRQRMTRIWRVAGNTAQPIFWHNGSTGHYWSFVGFRPDTGHGLVVLGTGSADPTDSALAALGGSIQPSQAPVDEGLFGQYRIEQGFDIDIYRHRGKLLAQATGESALVMHALGGDWYALNDADASIRFLRDEEGSVRALELVQDGVIYEARRVADVAGVLRRR